MDSFNRYFLEVFTKNYVNFKGRARRKEYWMFFLFNCIVTFLFAFIDNAILGVPLLGGIYYLAAILPSLSLSIRRLHDIGKDWPWLLIALIPLAGGIWLFVLTVTEGTKGDNEFGPDPKAADVEL